MKWFVMRDEKIEGPYSTDALLRKVETGDLNSETLVWGPLQMGWKSVDWWRQALPHLKSVQTELEAEDQWYYVKEGRRIGPLTRGEMVEQLRVMAGSDQVIARVLTWTKGFKKWTPVIEQHDLMNELEIDMRKHPRARAQGRLTVTFKGQTFESSLKTISEGGIGAEPIPMVYPGEEVLVTIHSDDLGPINAKAEVRYVNNVNLGLQFLSINSEFKSNIVSYVKKRMDANSHKSAA